MEEEMKVSQEIIELALQKTNKVVFESIERLVDTLVEMQDAKKIIPFPRKSEQSKPLIDFLGERREFLNLLDWLEKALIVKGAIIASTSLGMSSEEHGMTADLDVKLDGDDYVIQIRSKEVK